ncbi:MAG: ferredoxin [Thermoproteus sp.]|nr:ferredoxin [Thermoproteus sp.]
MLRVVVKAEECFACGLCYVLAPRVYEEGEGSKAVVAERYRAGSPYEGLVPEELADEAVRGMMTCPVKAIDVERVG